MPHRIAGFAWVALGLLGVIVLGALIVMGADTDRAARTGPRWKRRLITAGLVLLAALGVARDKAGAATTVEDLGFPQIPDDSPRL